MRAQGYLGGWVEFDGQFVTIGHRGVAGMVAGSADKRIHISQIASVQIKPAGLISTGFIQFGIPGGVERRGRYGRQTADAASDENSVVFRRGQQAAFEELARAIEGAMIQLRSPQPTQQPPDIAGQIAELWKLVQAGAMSLGEFEAAKARLLGSPRQWPTSPGHAPNGPRRRLG